MSVVADKSATGSVVEEPPIIDLSRPESEVLPEIYNACKRWGFFQIIRHNVSAELIDKFDEQSHMFFALPAHVKHQVCRSEKNPRGYFDEEYTKRTLDHKEGFDYGSDDMVYEVDGENRFHPEYPEFKEIMMKYYNEMENLGNKLTRLLSLSLGLEADALLRELKPHPTSFLRLNHYPATGPEKRVVGKEWGTSEPDPGQDGYLGVNKHTDAGILTILRQRFGDPASLQVYFAETGKFVSITPQKDAFVINVGDCLQVFSNDTFKSAIHRVLANNTRERYSAPFFLNPSYSTVVQSKMKLEKGKYRPFTWKQFRQSRFEGDFADYGNDDIQISDFKNPESKL